MELEYLKKKQKMLTIFDIFFVTLALLIGKIIHELNISSVAKIVMVIIIVAIIIVIDKAKYRQKWKIAQVRKINTYVFIGYIFIAAYVLSFVIEF